MKVVFVHTDFRIYWPARLKSLKEFLNQRNISLEIIEISGKGSPYNFAGNTNSGSPYWHILFPDDEMEKISPDRARIKIEKKLDEILPDIIFAGAIAFPSGSTAVKWAIENKRKVIIFDDARLSDVPRSSVVNFVKKSIYRCVDSIFTSSSVMDDTYTYFGFSREQIFYGVTAVDNNFWNSDNQGNNPLPCKDYFLTVSRQVPKKNLKMLMMAFNSYSKHVPNPKVLVLVGDGPERASLEQYVVNNRLENVLFLPFTSQEELRTIYKNSLCFMLTSLYGETWGLTVNEAMASGKPVLVSDQAGCSTTLVKNGINGYTFSPSDAGELSGLMKKLHELSDDELKVMGNNSEMIVKDWGLNRFCSGVYDAINYVGSRVNRKTCVLARILLLFWKGRYRPT